MSEEDKVPSPDGVGVVPEPEPETVRRRPKWLAPVAAGCVLVLLAVGGVAGYRMWSARELAEAKEACAVAADGARGAANDYNAVVNGQAAGHRRPGEGREDRGRAGQGVEDHGSRV